VPCRDPKRAAELFNDINTTRLQQQPLDLFKVRLTAELPDHVDIARIVERNGYAIGHTSGAKGLACVQALLAVYHMDEDEGPDILAQTLTIMRDAWGFEKTATRNAIARGIGRFVTEFYDEADMDRVADKLSKLYTPNRLYGHASAYCESHRCTTEVAVRDLLVAAYNNALKTGKHLRVKRPDSEA